jgi:hypothetical protein
LVVKEQPDDASWDPADIRYHTIRWFMGYDASFAIGPSHTNPYTGEILDADIGFSEGILRLGARRRYQYKVGPLSQLIARRDGEHDPASTLLSDHQLCTYGEELAEAASASLDLLAMRGDWTSEEEEEFVYQYTAEVTAHEVGHTLGLRHNFRASTVYDLDSLFDPEQHPMGATCASLMDYNPAIVAQPGQYQGDYLPQSVGPYDEWAIEYGYTVIPGASTPEDELPELRRVASRAADPMVPYATDEDAGLSARAMDPRNTRFDFGADPLEYYRHEYRLATEMWTRLADQLLVEGEGYDILRRAFERTWRPYFTGSHVAAKYIGGLYHNRDHYGDPDGRVPYTPVPEAAQRRALEFLAEEIWNVEPFQVPAELLQRLQYDRFGGFGESLHEVERFDYPLHDIVLTIQSAVFDELYHPIKLARIQDSQYLADGGDVFTMAELFAGIRSAVWSEVYGGEAIPSFRRNLQNAHLETISQLVLSPDAETPTDAVALARADLENLVRAIDELGERRPDPMTAAHLAAVAAQIERVLGAEISLGSVAEKKRD